VFDSIPTTLPGNVPSASFEATSTSEFGDYATFAGTSRSLRNVEVVMSSWGCQTGHWTDGSCLTTPGATFSHSITLKIYANSGSAPGALLGSVTQTFAIPFRPSADPADCTGANAGKWFSSADSTCYNGFATTITFDFSSSHVTLPSSVIYDVSYNTTHYGAAPIGESAACYTSSGGCGYDSLNVGAASTTPIVGTDDDVNGVFANASFAGSYCDGGVGGTGTFHLDTPCWTGFNPLVQFNVCAPTGVMRDGINLTAAQIGGTVTGTLDATGCNIGAYNPTSVSNAHIYGANYFGVLADGSATNVTGSHIDNIGEAPLNGSQHGNAIVYLGGASGTINGNAVSKYQKNGITVSGVGTSATVTNNIVTGEGHISYIAQNGIQISFGGSATVTGNTVSGNWYTPATVTACGLLLYQANGVKQSKNNLFDNQMNLCNFGRGGGNASVG
jgi:hypothetical protein